MISGRFSSDFHRIIICASDEGLFILRQWRQVFIDGTFRGVVIVAFDAFSNLTIPTFSPVNYQFTEIIIIKCNFHQLQALLRKMLMSAIPATERDSCM
ncbi:hypothetical protein MXB_1962, partial [Myxobolus squamalis]